MIALAAFLFWLSVAWIFYVFIGYPLLMATIARLRPRRLRKDPAYLPRVAFVMAAYNEEKIIAKKLRNYQELDYPRDRVELYVGSDASVDRTDEIIREFQAVDPSIHLARYDRSGKTRIVYELAGKLDAEIIVFTDADVFLEPDGLRRIVACFADPTVGGVIGRMHYHDAEVTVGTTGQRKFLEIEDLLRRDESLVWTTVGPRGECFAVRRGSYTPLDDYRKSDDVNLAITIPANGLRVWYEPEVVIHETNKRNLATEFRRRLRMGQQSMATFVSYEATRFPWRSLVGYQIWSHKVLRNFAAIPGTLFLISALLLALAGHGMIYTVAATLAALWLLLVVIGFVCEWLKLNLPILHYPLYFTAMLVGLTIGSTRASSGGLEMWNSQRVE
jgi:cellulose synthase/poly-beta-1,6-N-acetylglucosamine synthase-like glycosyltransferase